MFRVPLYETMIANSDTYRIRILVSGPNRDGSVLNFEVFLATSTRQFLLRQTQTKSDVIENN